MLDRVGPRVDYRLPERLSMEIGLTGVGWASAQYEALRSTLHPLHPPKAQSACPIIFTGHVSLFMAIRASSTPVLQWTPSNDDDGINA
jgi:hypothetical protein